MSNAEITIHRAGDNTAEQIYRLNPHECLRARVLSQGRRPVIRIERCKITGTGLAPTGVKFEIGLHRASALAQLILDAATMNVLSEQGVDA
ncbi:hypothetical protein [Bradyrhizobium sp. STM 3561]|uniref:hypothetical protein n=1 Tax=Bradyrhizobium sp. STM 3561 TaxID=578923 RepID=UPI00388D4434